MPSRGFCRNGSLLIASSHSSHAEIAVHPSPCQRAKSRQQTSSPSQHQTMTRFTILEAPIKDQNSRLMVSETHSPPKASSLSLICSKGTETGIGEGAQGHVLSFTPQLQLSLLYFMHTIRRVSHHCCVHSGL